MKEFQVEVIVSSFTRKDLSTLGYQWKKTKKMKVIKEHWIFVQYFCKRKEKHRDSRKIQQLQQHTLQRGKKRQKRMPNILRLRNKKLTKMIVSCGCIRWKKTNFPTFKWRVAQMTYLTSSKWIITQVRVAKQNKWNRSRHRPKQSQQTA